MIPLRRSAARRAISNRIDPSLLAVSETPDRSETNRKGRRFYWYWRSTGGTEN